MTRGSTAAARAGRILASGLCLSLAGLAKADNDVPLWNLAWVTDTQTPECEWITTLTRKVQANNPAMVIHTGDTRFEWANRGAWKDVMAALRIETPPIEFHLAPGNHDLTHGVLKPHLRRAATEGIYRLDTGRKAPGKGHYHGRVTEDASGPRWPVWNPEVARHPAWQAAANKRPKHHQHPEIPYRYVFKRGGIRFIVCDCYYTQEQRDWIRRLIVQPDDSSVSVILHHKHEVDDLAKYVEGLEGRHNVKLVLSGDHHRYCYEERHGVTFITAAGMANGHWQDSDAMTLWVYRDHLRLDRYVIPKGLPMTPIEGPSTIWTCKGTFSQYCRPAAAGLTSRRAGAANTPSTSPAAANVKPATAARTLSPNLLYNGDFDNHIWYERFRGWSPSGWYQWFTRGGHAPEHAVGKRLPHSGKEYVRIHMLFRAWRGGVLQNVRGVHPCHMYRLTAYGFFQPEGASKPNARVGIDPCGSLADQFAVDVTRHPAPKYDEGVGDDPKTPGMDGPDIPETTVWSDCKEHYRWGRFEVTAEARSDAITAILYCAPEQRPQEKPIYEMNWDTVALHEVPWPRKRLVATGGVLAADDRLEGLIVTVQERLNTAQVTWGTKIPTGASQVLYRFLDSNAVERRPTGTRDRPAEVRADGFPFETPVAYERSAKRHWIEIENLAIPESAAELQVVALSRALVDGQCKTLCSPPRKAALAKR